MTNPDMLILSQALIDFLAWFMIPFTFFVVTEFLTGLFYRG